MILPRRVTVLVGPDRSPLVGVVVEGREPAIPVGEAYVSQAIGDGDEFVFREESGGFEGVVDRQRVPRARGSVSRVHGIREIVRDAYDTRGPVHHTSDVVNGSTGVEDVGRPAAITL